MRVYLDTCVWCRPFDKPDSKINQEVKAIKKILKAHNLEIVTSSAVLAELSLISNEIKRKTVEYLVKTSSDIIAIVCEDVKHLAEKIKEDCKLIDFDAIHVALACLSADVFLTVDEGILRKANCLQKYITVMNPVEFNEFFRGSAKKSN